MPFRPSVHGWPFPNALTADPPALSLGAPPGPEIGVGAGMCWAALDRYLGGIRVPRDMATPGHGDPLHIELVRRHAAALSGLWPRVREWQAQPDREVGFRSRAKWRWIRDQLTAGEPVLLTVLPHADPYSRAYAASHVLATGCVVIEDRVILSIYDPARPDDDEGHLAFKLVGPPQARLSDGTSIRGFFPVPYDRGRPAHERLESFADPELLGTAHPVHGRLAAAAGGAGLELVARNPEGGLLHFRRRRRGRWQAEVVMRAGGSDLDEIQGDPALVMAHGRLHAFARTYVGDLLHFQRGLRWTATNRTAHEHIGPRFRLIGQPVTVTGPNGALNVFGRDPAGRIVHYSGTWGGRWTAERLPGDPIVGDPLATRIGGTLHLFGVDGDGRLIHWERNEAEWVSRDIIASGRWSPTTRLSGRPIPLVREETIYLFGQNVAGRLVHVRRSPTGHWHSVMHPVDIAGAPAAVTGPGGIHVFAASTDGGLVHRWGETVWHGEDLPRSRPGLDLPGPLDGTLHAWGNTEEMRVFGRWGGELVVLTWREDADWTAAALRDRSGVDPARLPAGPLILALDARGLPHLFGTDNQQVVVHIEQAPWIKPEADATHPPPDAPDPEPAADSQSTGELEPEPVPEAEPEPEAVPEPVPEPEPEPVPEPEPEPVPEAASVPAASIPEDELMDLSLLDSWPEQPRPPRKRQGEPHQ